MSKKHRLKKCPVCERGVGSEDSEVYKTMMENLDMVDDTDDIAPEVDDATPEELTDREKLEEYVAKLEDQLESGQFNLWTADKVEQLKKFLRYGFNEDGSQRILTNMPEVIKHQFSPEEALNLEGWWSAPAGEYGKLLRKQERVYKSHLENGFDPFEDGLELSKARSNGCFVVRNVQESADYFLNNSTEAAEKYGTTKRVIRMMGYALDGYKYMFPTFDFVGTAEDKAANAGVGHFALDPEVPFNDKEKEVYRWMFSRFHFGGAALVGGGDFQIFNLLVNPEESDPKLRESVAENSRHRMIAVTNHPWLTMPAAMLKWNTSEFKRSLHRQMCFMASAIDRGEKAPIPGYIPPLETFGHHAGTSEYFRARRELEGTASTDPKPSFAFGSELNKDGTPK